MVHLLDGHSGLPAVGASPRFLLDRAPIRPLAKPQAFYAFVDLAPGRHDLAIADERFFDQDVALQVPMAEPLADGIVACTLLPSPLYPYPAGTTLIRGRVTGRNAAGDAAPLPDVRIDARYTTARGKAMDLQTRTFGRGAYAGRYALALRGKLTPATAVALRFAAADGAGQHKQITIVPGGTAIVDAELV